MAQAPASSAEDRSPYRRVAFYFAAHQDDWQLFMTPAAFEDVLDVGTKTVFVHLTAGDAGLGTGTGGRKHPLYLAREHGARTAVRFMAGAEGQPAEPAVSRMQFAGHPIDRETYARTVTYFIRLPDGNSGGPGYPQTGHQSLRRLAQGEIDAVSAIDGSTVYHGWADLVATLRALLVYERDRAPAIRLHVPELDPRLNPEDHSDHLMTARVALDAAAEFTDACRIHHLGYASAQRPENLSGLPRDMKSAVYAATLAAVLALDHAYDWNHYDRSFVGRDYFRIEPGA